MRTIDLQVLCWTIAMIALLAAICWLTPLAVWLVRIAAVIWLLVVLCIWIESGGPGRVWRWIARRARRLKFW